MDNHECLRIAAKMLNMDVDDLPDELIKRIMRIREFIKIVKDYGELQSSQVIAIIVDNYLRDTQKCECGDKYGQ